MNLGGISGQEFHLIINDVLDVIETCLIRPHSYIQNVTPNIQTVVLLTLTINNTMSDKQLEEFEKENELLDILYQEEHGED